MDPKDTPGKTVIIAFSDEDHILVSTVVPDILEKLHRHPEALYRGSYQFSRQKGGRFKMPGYLLDDLVNPYRDRERRAAERAAAASAETAYRAAEFDPDAS